MTAKFGAPEFILLSLSVISAGIAVALASVGVGSANWQTTMTTDVNGRIYTSNIANFFYACRLNQAGNTQCGQRSSDDNNIQYYTINATGNTDTWNFHLDFASALTIIGIVFIFIGGVASLLMILGDRIPWMYFVAPVFLFLACLFMLAGLAEGSRVLKFNDYAAYLYETGHVITIFSCMTSALLGGRLFDPPVESQSSKKLKRPKASYR